jgi:PKD-like domain/IPT/TIG domain
MRKWMLGIGLLISAITIAQPTITQVSPNSASSGSTITITGTNLTGVSAISLGGTTVASFQVLSSTTVTAVVGSGATGAVSLTTAGGTTSFSGFTFLPTLPAINSMSLINCSGVSFEISPINGINGVVPAGTTYSWDVPLLTAAMLGAESKSGQTSIYGTLTNSTNVTQTAVYSVTPFKSGAGAGQPFTVTITILASANINPTGMITCSGVSFSITPINLINGQVPLNTLYNWDVPSITAAQITGGLSTVNSMNINGTLFNNTPLAQTATYTVTPNTSGCIGKNFTVTISLLPTATIQNFTRLTTSGNAFTISPMNLINGTIPSGTLYSWNAPTGLVTGGQTGIDSPNITGTLNNATGSIQTATYLVSPKSGNCIGSVFSVVVTVQSTVSSPTITSFAPTSAGAGTSITITGTNFTGVSAITLGGTAVSSFQVLSSTTIRAVVGSGSTGALSISTSGGIASFAGFTYLNNSLSVNSMTAVTCSGVGFQLSPIDGVNGIIPQGTTYSWGSPQVTSNITGGQSQTGKAFIYGTLVNSSFTIQTATYTVVPYEASSGLGASFTVTITVLPAAQIAAFSRVICSGVGFTITPVNFINGTIPSGTFYNWGTPITSTPSFTGNLSGSNQVSIFGTLQNKTNTLQSATYTVTPTTFPGNCAGAPFPVTIYVNPTADISPITLGICTGVTFSITPDNNVHGIIPLGTTYRWSLPSYNAAVSGGQANSGMNNISGNLSNTSHTIQQAIYQVTPTAPICADGAAFSVVVNLSPRPAISGISTSTCSGVGFMVTPTNGIHGTVPDSTLYSWSLPTSTGTITGSESRTDNPSIITGLLFNRTNTIQTVTYSVTPRFGDCIGNVFTVVVTLYPTAEINALSTVTCSGTSFSITITNQTHGIVPNGTQYSWNTPLFTGTVTGGASATNNMATVLGMFSNRTNQLQTATYVVTPNSGSCLGAPFTFTVWINPTPEIVSFTNATCSGVGFSITPTNGIQGIIPVATLYTWAMPQLSSASLTGGQTGFNSTNIVGAFINNSNTTQTATYTITPSTPNCGNSYPFSLVVSVFSTPQINPLSVTVCSGVTFTLSPTNFTNGIVPTSTLYTWASPTYTALVVGGQSGNNQSFISGTLTNLSNVSQEAYFTITPRLGNCVGSAFMLTVYLNPTPVINSMSTVTCSGVQFSITPTNNVNGIIPFGTTYRWNMPTYTATITGGASAVGQSNMFGSLRNTQNTTQTATYIVTPNIANCGDGAPFTVTVMLPPTPEINTITTVTCSGVTFMVTPTNGTNGIVPVSTVYSWNAPTFSGTVTGGASATYNPGMVFGTLSNRTNTVQTVTYRVVPVSGSCTGSMFTLIVTLNPMPEVAAITRVTCSGVQFSVTPTNATNGIIPPSTLYSWSTPTYMAASVVGGQSGNNQSFISGTLTNLSNLSQEAYYTITPRLGNCVGSAFMLTVYLNPTPVISTMSTVTCSGVQFSITPTNNVNGIIPIGTTYRWNMPTYTATITGGTSAAGVSNVFGGLLNRENTTQTANYKVTPNIANCGDGAPFTVSVVVLPTAEISSITTVTCSGVTFSVTPTNNTHGIVPENSTYSWNAPTFTSTVTGGASATYNPGMVFGTLSNRTNTVQTVTYRVVPVSGNCVGAMFSLIVTLNPMPEVSAITTVTCSGVGFVVTPTNVTNGIVPGAAIYSWNLPAYTGIVTGGATVMNNLANVFGLLSNRTNLAQTVTYTVIPRVGNCIGAAFSIIVTLQPAIEIVSITQTINSGSLFAISPSNGSQGFVSENTRYSWNVPTYSSASVTGGISASNQANIFGTLTNATNSIQTATYSINPIAGNCTGVNFTVTVSILPTLLPPTILSFTPSSAGTGATITITGINLNNTSAITLGGISVASFTVVSSTTINAVVGNGATGALSLITPGGSAILEGFTYINQIPSINPINLTICSGVSFSISPVNGINGFIPTNTTYSWMSPIFTSTTTGGQSKSGQPFISGTLVNQTNEVQTATYIVTPFSIDGEGNPFTVTITILPSAVINTITSVTCSGIAVWVSPTNGINGIVPTNTLYSWASPSYSSASVSGGISGTSQTSITGTLLNNQTNTTQTATYIVVPQTGTCAGATFSFVVTINPTPKINIQTIVSCSGVLMQLTPLPGGNGILPSNTLFSWEVPVLSSISVTGGVSRSNQNIFSYQLTNSTNTIQSATYTIVPHTTNGCTGNAFTITVNLQLKPLITPISTAICSGLTFIVNPADGVNGIVPVGTQYRWSMPSFTGTITGGQSISGMSNIYGLLYNNTNSTQTVTYQVIPSTSFCGNGSAFTVVVSLYTTPMIAAMSSVINSGISFGITPSDVTNGIIPNNTRYSWNVPSYTASISGGQSAVNQQSITGLLINQSTLSQTAYYNVTPISTQGCIGMPFSLALTVQPNLSAPTITSFTPSSARTNETITITGTNLNTTTAITLGGTAVASFQVSSSTSIAAVVGNGATGAINISTSEGTTSLSGFTFIPPSPSIISFAPNSGPVGTLVTIRGSNLNKLIAINIGGVPAIPVSISDSNIVAFVMPGASTGIVSIITTSGTAIANGTYSITISQLPNGQQGPKLEPGGKVNDYQGFSVALSADGNTAVVGAIGTNNGSGSVWVYTRKDGIWNTNGELLTANDATSGAYQGTSVAISADGKTIIYGGLTDNNSQGAAWIFIRNENNWTQQGSKLICTDKIGAANFGKSVSISADGKTAIVSGNKDNDGKGAAWIFIRDGNNWTQQGSKLFISANTFNFGSSVSLSADGNTALIGESNGTGGAWVFVRNNGIWLLQGDKLIGSGSTGASLQGASTSLSADGNTAIIGGPGDASSNGAAWIFTRNGNSWSQQGNKLVGTGNVGFIGAQQGSSVSISADGNTAIIGGFKDSMTSSYYPATGASWIFNRIGNSWTQYGNKIVGNGADSDAEQGKSVAISANASTVIIGGWMNDLNAGHSGASWIFTYIPPPIINSFTPTSARTQDIVKIIGNNFREVTSVSFGGVAAKSFSIASDSSIVAVVGNGASGEVALSSAGGTTSLSGFTFILYQPVVSSMSAVTCSGVGFTLSPVNGLNGTIPSGTTYSWSAPQLSAGLTGAVSRSNQSAISGTLLNTTITSLTAVYSVIPTHPINGTGASFTVTITVLPTAFINTLTTVTCSGVTFTITPTHVISGIIPQGTLYTWMLPQISTPSLTGGQTGFNRTNITGLFINNTNTTQTVTYVVTPTTTLCGASNSFSVIVTVYPTAQISPLRVTVCSGVLFRITPTNNVDGIIPDGTTYRWNMPTYTATITGGTSSVGQSNVFGSLRNTQNTTQTATYIIIPSIATCGDGAPFVVTASILPIAEINAINTVTCSGVQFTITPTNSTNGIVPQFSRYTWTVPTFSGTVTGGSSATNNVTIVSGLLNNRTNTTQTATFIVTPSTPSGCVGANFTVTITLPPTAEISSITTITCSGVTFIVTPTNNTNGIIPDGSTFSWNAPTFSGTVTGGASASNNFATVFGTLSNRTNLAQTITYVVIPRVGNCVGAAFSLIVTLQPTPEIVSIAQTTNSGTPFAISPANGLQGIVPFNTCYSWSLPTLTSVSVTGGLSASNQTNIFGTLTNTTNSIQTATYTINPIAGNCTGANFTVNISLLPTINAPTITSFTPSSSGTGATITITGTNLNNTSSISLGGISVASFQVISSTTIMAVVGSGATGALSLTAAGGTAAISGFVFIASAPGINSISTVTCSGVGFTISPVDGINGTIPSGTTFSWSAPQLSAGLTGAVSRSNQSAISGSLVNTSNTSLTAVYTVIPYHSINGTGAPFSVTVTVHPTALINTLTTVTCSGVTFTITPTHVISGIIPQGTLFTWTLPQISNPSLTGGQTGFNSTNITGLFNNNTNTTQTVTYSVTPITTLCGASNSFSVIVTVYPTAQISPLSVSVCSGNTFTLTPTNFTNGIVPAVTRYTWSVPIYTGSITGGDSKIDISAITGTLLNNSSVLQTATYFVSPKSGFCVGPAFTVTVSINPIPEVSAFSITGCRRVTFTAAPTNGNIPSNTLYSWPEPTYTASMVGGHSGSNQRYLVDTLANVSNLPQEAYYILTPRAGNCVGANFTLTVYISPVPVINAISMVTCSGVPFVVSPTNGADGIVPIGIRYKWDIPTFTGTITGGEANNGPSNIFGTLRNTTNTAQTATYIVTPFVVTCGLGDPFTVTISVLPAAEINAITTVTCSGIPFVVTPTNGTNGIVPGSTLYSWSAPIFTGTVTGGVSATNYPTFITGNLLNRTNLIQTATYIVTPRVGNCVGAAFSVIVTLQPTPEITNIALNTNSGTPFAFTPANGLQGIVPNNTRYSWSIPTITSASVTGAQNGNNQSTIFGTLSNPSNSVQTATYLISPLASNCIGASFTLTVSIKPTFQITAFAPTSAGTGATVSIRGKGFTNITQISFGGSVASSFSIISDTAATAIVGVGASGFVKITSPLSVDSLSGFTFGLPIIRLYRADSTLVFGAEKGKYSRSLNYSISANFLQNPLQIAAPDNFQVSRFQDSAFSSSLSLNHQNGTIDSTKIFVRFKLDTLGSFTGSIVHTSLAATTRSITVTGSSKCDSVVYITPIVNNILADTIICFKDSLVLSTTSGTFNNYLWSTGDTTKNLVVKSSGSYSLQVGSGKGCLSNVSRIIKTNKNTNPIPSLAFIGNKTLISSNAPKYRWLVNNTLIPGNNTNSLVPSKIGFYAVETTNDSICWDRSTDYPIFVLSNPLVNDTLTVKVYPNPTSNGTFYVVASLKKYTNVVARVTIADGNGNIILQTNKFIFFGREVKIPITLSIKGTVFAKIDINGDIKTQTVILQ